MPKDKGEVEKKCDNVSTSRIGCKRTKSPNSEYDNNAKKYKKGNSLKPSKAEEITKSKLLTAKQKVRQRVSGNSIQLRVCGNGKPMPSLAELEKMFDDSDEELTCTQPAKELPSTEPPAPVIMSPENLENITTKIIKCIDELADSTQEKEPVYPVKRSKKSKDAYIVGCTKRDQVIKKIKSKIGQGDTKYGVNPNENNMTGEDEKQPTRKIRSKYKNPITSKFNSKTDEIVEMLEGNSGFKSDSSYDSNDTLAYDVNGMPLMRKKHCNFSPIPSTSKDNETFLINDMKFNESLVCDNSVDSVEVIDFPCETILLDEENTNNLNNSVQINPDPEIEEVPYDFEPTYDIPLIDLDYYNFDVNHSQDCEIIDVDDVIAETQAILEKRRSRKKSCDLTPVSPQTNTQFTSYDNKPILKKPLDTPSPPGNRIGEVVKDFFDQWNNDQTNSVSDVNNYNLSADVNILNPTILANVMNYMKAGAQAIINKIVQGSQSSNNSQTIDQSSLTANTPNCSPSIQVIPDDVPISSNDVSTPNNDSVIFVPHTPKQKKRQSKNKRAIKVAKAIPDKLKSNANNTKTGNAESSTYRQPSNFQNFGECPICFDNFTKTNMASTICGHLFCISCIEKTIHQSGRKCPNCRKQLKGVGYHKIYLQ